MSNETTTEATEATQEQRYKPSVLDGQGYSLLQWASTPQEHYNEVEDFDDAIGPLVEVIANLCNAMGVPYYMAFIPAYGKDEAQVRDIVGGISAARMPAQIAIAAASVREDEAGIDAFIEAAELRAERTKQYGELDS